MNAKLSAMTLLITAALSAPVLGAEATCATYLQAIGEDRSLFDGFIYGYVAAKLDGQGNYFEPTVIGGVTLTCPFSRRRRSARSPR